MGQALVQSPVGAARAARARRQAGGALPRRRSGRGFTLVELLTVVAIISLLVTITMPSLQQAMKLARMTVCGANLNTIGRGVRVYLSDTDAKEPWRWTDGGYDLPWEWARGQTDASGRLAPISWGNPAIALTRDFGLDATDRDDGFVRHRNRQDYVATAEAFFCPLSRYRYEENYRRQGIKGLPLTVTDKMWGTYQWMYPIDRDEDDNPRRVFNYTAKDVLMLDFAWYGATEKWEQHALQTYWHYHALLLNGSVRKLSGKTKDVWWWLFGPQPDEPRQVRDFNDTYTLREGVR